MQIFLEFTMYSLNAVAQDYGTDTHPVEAEEPASTAWAAPSSST
jgi:hypothetical protein